MLVMVACTNASSPQLSGRSGATATTTACAASVPSTASLPNGWTWLADCRYAFLLPIPPGWRHGTYQHTSPDGFWTEYTVQLLPPNATGALSWDASLSEPELIQVSVILASPGDPAQIFVSDQDNQPEATPISIGGDKVTLYDRTSAENGVERQAVTRFGAYPYEFYLKTPPDRADQDVPLFRQLLQDFTYTGPSE